MKTFTTIAFALSASLLQAELTSDEQKQRAAEESVLQQAIDREKVTPIPKIYEQLDDCFIAREPSSEVSSNGFAFRFGNPTKKPIYFSGWEPASPHYKIQIYNGTIWKDEVVLVCGTGLGIRELPPGKSVLLDVRAHAAKFRVGVALLSNDKTWKTIQTIWSK